MQDDDLSTLGGDFFVYSDVFSEGIPAYWSGYFSTRPFMKQLSRELEANLRAAEILFTVGYQISKVYKLVTCLSVGHIDAFVKKCHIGDNSIYFSDKQ